MGRAQSKKDPHMSSSVNPHLPINYQQGAKILGDYWFQNDSLPKIFLMYMPDNWDVRSHLSESKFTAHDENGVLMVEINNPHRFLNKHDFVGLLDRKLSELRLLGKI